MTFFLTDAYWLRMIHELGHPAYSMWLELLKIALISSVGASKKVRDASTDMEQPVVNTFSILISCKASFPQLNAAKEGNG